MEQTPTRIALIVLSWKTAILSNSSTACSASMATISSEEWESLTVRKASPSSALLWMHPTT